MSEFLKVMVLAVVQGITEFLPISSSGHLVVMENWLGLVNPEDNLYLTILLHAGTLLAILVYYFRDLWMFVKQRSWRVGMLIVVGTLPLVFIGVFLEKAVEDAFGNLWLTIGAFVVTAFMLLVLHKREPGETKLEEMTWKTALIIGFMQCVAVLPGVSRSGTTISTATRLGLTRETAARFSFFLGIPAIGGATFLKLVEVIRHGGNPTAMPISTLCVGFFVSFVVGYFSLALLLRFLQGGKFHFFGYYCLVLAVGLSIQQLV